MYQIEHFALRDEMVKRVHHFLDGSSPIPPVHVQDVDVRGAKLLERFLGGDVERLCVISRVVDLMSDVILTSLVVG